MKLGIMQPYFFPYIGYWQRINAVNKHVIYDDVNFIKGGWINRNRIMIGNEIHFFNLPMLNASPNKLINEVGVRTDKVAQRKMLQTLEQAYKRAPYYGDIAPMLFDIITCSETNLAKYLTSQLRIICGYLQIKTELLVSSEIQKNNSLRAQDKVLEICRIIGASEYYNALSGSELYDKAVFAEHNIKLKFIEANTILYKRFRDEFEPNLSIIDVMMFNSVPEIREMLNDYIITL
jgi:WbqC-like protein family.